MSSNPLSLQDPSHEELQKVYRKLKRFELLHIYIEREELESTLLSLEKIGFIGSTIHLPQQDSQAVYITTLKAKNGPCFDTGQRATYQGSALAVLDDDQHLTLKNQPLELCLKTAEIYQSETYASSFSISPPDQKLLEALNTGPKIFDCDDYEASLHTLLKSLPDPNKKEPLTHVFYAGPFKAIIAQTGHVLRRGQSSSIPQTQYTLLKHEGVLETYTPAQEAPHLETLVQENGTKALLNLNFIYHEKGSESFEYTPLAWQNISSTLKTKVLNCIEQNHDSFIITGSDPQDELGCCPSEDVGIANRLKRQGYLEKVQADHDQDNCPIQTYCFRGEYNPDTQTFHPEQTFREKVQQSLGPSYARLVLKVILILFIVASLFIAITKGKSAPPSDLSLDIPTFLESKNNSKSALILFHLKKRCDMCIQMEELSKTFAAEHQIDFYTISMDKPAWQSFIDREGLFSASLYFSSQKESKAPHIKLLKEAWELWNHEEKFKNHLLLQLND